VAYFLGHPVGLRALSWDLYITNRPRKTTAYSSQPLGTKFSLPFL